MEGWYPGKLLLEDIIPYIKRKTHIYSEKFKEFDERIIYGVAICYKHSPTFRKHFDSEHFGKTMGWRITHLWTKNTKEYPALNMIGPLDLGLYCVRIDAILENNDITEFLREAKTAPIFKKYIHATTQFMISLLANQETSWLYYKDPDTTPAIELCSEYSSTLREILKNGNGDGWDLVKLWTEKNESIKSLRRIYPLDIAIYCIRLDSIIYGTDLNEFSKKANKIQAFKLFPMEILRFTNELSAI